MPIFKDHGQSQKKMRYDVSVKNQPDPHISSPSSHLSLFPKRGGAKAPPLLLGEMEFDMAMRSMHFCNHHGCNELTTNKYCAKHQAEQIEQEKIRRNLHDQTRGSSTKRGYGYKWQEASKGYLAHHPLCEECLQNNKLVPAKLVDHIVPHKGNQKLFWDRTNWQALCVDCHAVKTAKEDGGFGNPVRNTANNCGK